MSTSDHYMTESVETLTEGFWREFARSTPEKFWDVAVWRDEGWLPGCLDVADRKRIVLGVLASDALAQMLAEARAEALRDGSRDATVGADGESPDEPTDPRVRDLAALAYLVVTCEALDIEADEEWDEFEYARAIHRRIRAALTAAEATEAAR